MRKGLYIFLTIILSALTSADGFEGQDRIDKLISIIESKGVDWRLQIKAIREISESHDPRGIEILLRLLNDPFLNYDCPALIFNAAMALGRYKGDSRVVETLLNLASDIKNPISVREAAIQSLGEIQDRRALNPLIDLLRDASFAIRSSSIKAIGKIGDPSAIPYLEVLLEREPDLRSEGYIVLNMLKANGRKRQN
jgi:hypothetical protein